MPPRNIQHGVRREREEEEVNLPGAELCPGMGLFTHGWCRHLFTQHPPLPQANVTQPIVQNAPAELLNNVEHATAGNLLSGSREEMQKIRNIYMNYQLAFLL